MEPENAPGLLRELVDDLQGAPAGFTAQEVRCHPRLMARLRQTLTLVEGRELMAIAGVRLVPDDDLAEDKIEIEFRRNTTTMPQDNTTTTDCCPLAEIKRIAEELLEWDEINPHDHNQVAHARNQLERVWMMAARAFTRMTGMAL